jgi:hypothetical protein
MLNVSVRASSMLDCKFQKRGSTTPRISSKKRSERWVYLALEREFALPLLGDGGGGLAEVTLLHGQHAPLCKRPLQQLHRTLQQLSLRSVDLNRLGQTRLGRNLRLQLLDGLLAGTVSPVRSIS